MTEVILTIQISGQLFCGVKVEAQDTLGLDWPRSTTLLWVVETTIGYKLPAADLPIVLCYRTIMSTIVILSLLQSILRSIVFRGEVK